MLSWIFRNRARMQIVYGTVEPPPLAGARFGRSHGGDARRPDGLGLPPAPARPGELRRFGRRVEMRPMPRRVG